MDATATSDTYRFGPFRLETRGAGLSRLGDDGTWKPVAIGSRALELLLLLLRRHGEVLSREEIMDAVWPDVAVEESNLTVQISALRRALDPSHAGAGCIQTISGRGYRFLPTVTSELAGAPIDNQGTVAHTSASDRRQRLSIIVAPFKSLSDDPDSALLADTITEQLTGDLARLPGTVVMTHAAIGTDSSASHLIQGSVRRTTDLTRVNVQLIDRATSTHLWAEWFDVDRATTADDRDEIAGRLLRTLTVKLIEEANRRIEADPSRQWTSEDLVMRGRAMASRPLSAGEPFRGHKLLSSRRWPSTLLPSMPGLGLPRCWSATSWRAGATPPNRTGCAPSSCCSMCCATMRSFPTAICTWDHSGGLQGR